MGLGLVGLGLWMTRGCGCFSSISVMVVGGGRRRIKVAAAVVVVQLASLAWLPRRRRHISGSNCFLSLTTRCRALNLFSPQQHQHRCANSKQQQQGVRVCTEYTCFSSRTAKEQAASRLLPETGAALTQLFQTNFLVSSFFSFSHPDTERETPIKGGTSTFSGCAREGGRLSGYFSLPNAGSAKSEEGVRVFLFFTYSSTTYYSTYLNLLVLLPQNLFFSGFLSSIQQRSFSLLLPT